MNKENLLNDLLVELECPVCTDYMQPPISQCKNGHSICNGCSSKVIICPTCKADIPDNSRCFALEKLAEKLVRFRYENSKRGCIFHAFNAIRISQHEITCHFITLQCPLAKEEGCEWRGIADDMRNHCVTAHKEKTRTLSQLKLKVSDFAAKISSTINSTYVFFVYGQVFKFVTKISSETCFLGWCVFHLTGNANTSRSIKNYNYRITIFEKGNFVGQSMSLCGPCPLVPFGEIAEKELEKYLVGNSTAFLTNFLKCSILEYKLNIIKPDDGK